MSRGLKLLLFPMVIFALGIVSLPQSSAHAQTCFDENKKPIECPVKEPPPPDSDDPPSEDKSRNNHNQGSANTIILPTSTLTPTTTSTSTNTPQATDTKVPTATATKPAVCNCTNANSLTTGPQDAPIPAPPPESGPAPAPFTPWLAGFAGILIGLILGALAGPAIFGGSLFPRGAPSSPAPAGTGGSLIDTDESTPFIKLTHDGLVDFEPHLSTANQVSEVHVKAYDPEHKKEIVGSARPQSSALGDLPPNLTHQKADMHIKQDEDKIATVEAEIYEEDVSTKFDK